MVQRVNGVNQLADFASQQPAIFPTALTKLYYIQFVQFFCTVFIFIKIGKLRTLIHMDLFCFFVYSN